MELINLKLPFAPDELEWKPQTIGENDGRIWLRCLAYVTNRAIMDRLDEVCGPENWKNEYARGPEGGVICGISIKINGEWVTKWDGSENTDIEAVKGGLSGAMKRSAVQWGIGRYLYDLEENFGNVSDGGIFSAKTKDGKKFRWSPPNLPKWALPGLSESRKMNDLPTPTEPIESTDPKVKNADLPEVMACRLPELTNIFAAKNESGALVYSQAEKAGAWAAFKALNNGDDETLKGRVEEFIQTWKDALSTALSPELFARVFGGVAS